MGYKLEIMSQHALLTTILGFGLALCIAYLIRRDHLYLRDGLFWILIALLSVGLGTWPGLVDLLGKAVGVAYPPALLFVVAILVLFVRTLMADISNTKLKRDIRRLNQRMALYEAECQARNGGVQENDVPRNREGL